MTSDENSEGIDDFLNDMLTEWRVPGLAVVALKDKEVLYEEGYGYRDIENKMEMTPRTIHPIASCTKSFTSTAIAMLVDEGELEWNTPIREFIPKFKLKDPVASNHVSIVDMLSHRTGLPRHDFVWLDGEFTYDRIFDRLPHLEPNKGIRVSWQYCNLMYLAASAIIEQLSGMNYNEFVTERIFKPLGMKDSNFSVTVMQKEEDYALPYKPDFGNEEGNFVRIDFVNNDVATGAGCINSSISDMGKWLRLHLNNGRVDDNQLVSPGNLSITHDSTIFISMGYRYLEQYVPNQKWFRMESYGLGWGGMMYRGHRLVQHSGGIDGSSSRMIFLPDEGIGVMTVVNQSFGWLQIAAAFSIIDRVLGLESIDWTEILKPIYEKEIKVIGESGVQSQRLRKSGTRPTHPLLYYVGKYQHPGYGQFEFYIEEEELKAKYGSIEYPLSHYHFDTFQFEVKRLDFKELLTFQTDSVGEIVGFTIKLEALVPPITFKRLPEDYLRDKEFLKTLVGKYEAAGINIEIALKGDDAIMCTFSGQTPIELEPEQGMRFKPKGSDAFSLTFKRDESGEISEFLYTEMGYVIPAKRKS